MAVSTGDLLQFTAFQEYLGEVCLNVFYYRWFSAPTVDNSYLSPLWSDFRTEVVDRMITVQNTFVEYTNVQIKNLSNGVDFFEQDPARVGLVATDEGSALPSYMTLSFKLVRDSLVTRNGAKRLAGLTEAQVEGNEYAGAPTDMDEARVGMLASLSVGLVTVAAPIIVKRPIVVPAGTGYVYSSVSSVAFMGLGTQNTRKQGRGI